MLIKSRTITALHNVKRWIKHTVPIALLSLSTACTDFSANQQGFLVLPPAFGVPFVQSTGTTTYVNSVQQVSITIAAAATSNTASVSAASGTFFLIFQGQTTSATTNNGSAVCRVSISGTTVTATRANSTQGACVVNCVVVDATSNLVTSVQFGTIAVTAGTSGTATISSVTTANAVVHLLGYTSGLTTFNMGRNHPTLVLTNATTVTSTVRTLTTNSTAGFVVIEFNPAALNQSKQAFSKSWTNSALSSTQAITSVNINNTILFYAGCDNDQNETNATDEQRITLTNATTVTTTTGVAQGDASIVINFSVIEFISGVLSQNAQRGSITLSASTSNTATITSALTTKTICNFLGYSTATTAVTTHATLLPNITQTNATTDTATLNSLGSVVVSFENLTFN